MERTANAEEFIESWGCQAILEKVFAVFVGRRGEGWQRERWGRKRLPKKNRLSRSTRQATSVVEAVVLAPLVKARQQQTYL